MYQKQFNFVYKKEIHHKYVKMMCSRENYLSNIAILSLFEEIKFLII